MEKTQSFFFDGEKIEYFDQSNKKLDSVVVVKYLDTEKNVYRLNSIATFVDPEEAKDFAYAKIRKLRRENNTVIKTVEVYYGNPTNNKRLLSIPV